MPQTYKDYGPMEVAILARSFAPHTGGTKERSIEGDIVAVRRPHHVVGTGRNQDGSRAKISEVEDILWVCVEGWDYNDYAKLTDSIDGFDKRRYCIPLDRLKQAAPYINLARVRDVNDAYQPCVPFDDDEGWYHHHRRNQNVKVRGLRIPGTAKRPLAIDGLVFDKATGRYL